MLAVRSNITHFLSDQQTFTELSKTAKDGASFSVVFSFLQIYLKLNYNF